MRPLLPVLCALLPFGCAKSVDTGPPNVDPRDPIVVLDRYDGPSFAELLEVRTWGDDVLFCSAVQGLNVYDASDPERLRFRDDASFEHSSFSYPRCQHLAIDPEGERVFAAAHADRMASEPWIEVFDASNLDRLDSVWSSTFPDFELEGIEYWNGFVLAAAHDTGLVVFEVRDDGSLANRAVLQEFDNAWTVRVEGTVAWVADGAAGIKAVSLQDPTAPAVVGALDLPGVTKHIDVDGDRLFAALGSGGVAIVDISVPANPVLLDHHDTPGSALAVGWGAEPNVLMVSDWNDLRVFTLDEARSQLSVLGREPLNFGPGAQTRSLGLAARDDVMFSANWTELVSYRVFPDRMAPDLFVTPVNVPLPATAAGQTTERAVLLQNQGTHALELGAVRADAGLTVDPLPEQLAPGELTAALVRWTADDDEPFTGSVVFHSDDPDQPEIEIAVYGNGAGLGVGELLGDRNFQAIDGSRLFLSDHEGPVLLAYFATF